VAIVPAAGCTYPEILFRQKSLRLFSRKTEDKKPYRQDLNPHIHTSKAVMLPTGLLEFPTDPSGFKH